MPEFFVALRTGHELTSLSALYEYLGAALVLTLPAGLVLAGWQPMPWGQTGYGSAPATVQCLVMCGVKMEDLDLVIDNLFHLSDTSPPQYLKGGPMRPTIEADFATTVMYYKERVNAAEMRSVQVICLCVCVGECVCMYACMYACK
jgi:hypothetical protein